MDQPDQRERPLRLVAMDAARQKHRRARAADKGADGNDDLAIGRAVIGMRHAQRAVMQAGLGQVEIERRAHAEKHHDERPSDGRIAVERE